MKICILIYLFLLSGWVVAQDNTAALLPMPNRIIVPKGKPLRINSEKTSIYFNRPELEFAAQSLQEIFKERTHQDIPFSESKKAAIRLMIDPTLKNKEHYCLQTDAKGMTITGSTAAAVYYGVMTVDQLLLGDVCATMQKLIRPINIDDMPRFSRRAFMLDPARHFLPPKDIKFFIDQMARYKYNVLQLHLTDDEGWRMEIKKHPQLASKDHYTQEQLKDIIQYAAQRGIEIVPELDIPGHTVAILAAYPELGCSLTDTIPKIVGKTTNLMLCASEEKVYTVFGEIIDEVSKIFPSKYIHLGGDEAVVERNWAKCPRCQAMMKKLGYTKASQLMTPFFKRILSNVEKNGKEPILWCELDNIYPPANDYLFPYPKNVTLVTWRNGLTPTCLKLTRQHGNPIIMAPGEYAYLNRPQWTGELPNMPLITLEKSYQFDPGYGVPASEQAHIVGVMGTLWGEFIQDIHRLNYMTYPRGLALAEAGWTQMEHRSWESFKQRIYPNLMNLMRKGVSLRVPFEIVYR